MTSSAEDVRREDDHDGIGEEPPAEHDLGERHDSIPEARSDSAEEKQSKSAAPLESEGEEGTDSDEILPEKPSLEQEQELEQEQAEQGRQQQHSSATGSATQWSGSAGSRPPKLRRHLSDRRPSVSAMASPLQDTYDIAPIPLKPHHTRYAAPARGDTFTTERSWGHESASDKHKNSRSLVHDMGLHPEFHNHVVEQYHKARIIAWLQGKETINCFTHVREAYRHEMEKSRLNDDDGARWNQRWTFSNTHSYRAILFYLLASKRAQALMILIDFISDVSLLCLYIAEMAYIGLTPQDQLQAFYDAHTPAWLYTPRPDGLWKVLFAFSICSVLALGARFVFRESFLRAVFSVGTLVDMVTCIPLLMVPWLHEGHVIYVPYFLRSLVIVPHLRRLLNVRMEIKENVRPFAPLKERLIVLVVTLCVILFLSMCALQYTELHWGNQVLTVIELLYFVVVTIATVGYGDVTPHSTPGRLVVVATIIIALSAVPSLVSSVIETLKQQSVGAGSYTKGRVPHIVIIGKFESITIVTDVLHAFHNNEWNKPLRIVFLSPSVPTLEIKSMLSSPLYQNITFYIQGSVQDEQSLERAQVRSASAIFFLPDRSLVEDERNIFRVWATHKFAPRVPLYVFTHRREFAPFFEDFSAAVVCSEEIKQVIMGYNCLYRGVATLITNMVGNSPPTKQYRDLWVAQYGDGAGNEIYSDTVNLCFVGRKMNEISAFLFREYQVILFAVRIRVPSKYARHPRDVVDEDRCFGHLLLNPGATYKFQRKDECYFLAQRVSEVHAIRALTMPMFQKLMRRHSGIFQSFYDGSSTVEAHEMACPSGALMNRMGPAANRLPRLRCDAPFTTLAACHPDMDDRYMIAQPEGPYIDHNTPLCHLLRKPTQSLRDVTIRDAKELEGHIVVATSHWDVFRFLCTIRSAQLPPEQLRPVLFFASSMPTEDEFLMLSAFPQLYYMQGNPRRKRDLKQANVAKAARIVVFSHPGHSSRGDEFPDLQAVLTKHLIHHAIDDQIMYAQMRGEGAQYENIAPPFISVELYYRRSIKFMGKHHGDPELDAMPALRKDGPTHSVDVTFDPAFASGYAFVDSMLDNTLFQTYFNNTILDIVKLLCGLRSRTELIIDHDMKLQSSYLCYIDVPEDFVDKPFGELYENLAVEHGVIPLGLYRAPCERLNNKFHFVYTNPPPKLLVKETDLVYVLNKPWKDEESA
ncbi:hypothetical protein RI367_001085 [Sorochytrium milnesiophthora]